MRQLRRALPFAVAASLAIAACGGDDGGAPAPTVADTEGPSAPTTQSPATPDSTTGHSSPDDSGAPSDRCPADAAGSSLTVGVYSFTKGLDPAVSTGSGQTGGSELAAIYDTLMRWNEDTREYEPRLAEALTPDDDFSTWTLTLRPDVHFGNGDPFTTAAVAANIERLQDPDLGSVSRVFAELVASTEIVDDRTMVFELVEPWSEFPYVLADEAGMIPNPAVIDQLGAEAFNLAPTGAGAGPFEVATFAPGEELVLTAKDDYWGGDVCLDTLTFASSGTSGATIDSFDTGQFDVAVVADVDQLAELAERGVQLHSESVGGVGLLVNNGVGGTTPPTTDVRLRQAITLALDPVALDERIYEGAGEPTSALFGERSIYGGAAGPDSDPAAAAALVEEVKGEGEWDGSIRLACQSDVYADQRVAVAAALRAVGFDVEEEQIATTAALVQKVIIDTDYDVACWSLQLFDSATWVSLNRSLRSDSSANRIGYANPEMDAALDQVRTAIDVDARRAAIAEIQRIWNETAPSVVLRASQTAVAFHDDVHGLAFDHEAITYFDQAYIG